MIYHGPADLVAAVEAGTITEGDAAAVERFAAFLREIGSLPVCECDAHPYPHKHASPETIAYARGISDT